MDAVVFDFDGVIVRNARMANVVGRASEQFVARHMGCTKKGSKVMNRNLYMKHGHTALGVAHVMRKDSREIVDDFNRFVYGRMNYALIEACVRQDDRMRLRELAELVVCRDVVTGLFTNAPLDWCDKVCTIVGVDMDRIVNQGNYVTSDNCYLKPNIRSYHEVEAMFSDVTKRGGDIYFLEDSLINIDPVYNRQTGVNWKCTLVRDDSVQSVIKGLPHPFSGC